MLALNAWFLIPLGLLSTLPIASACNIPGLVNGQCVELYRNPGCVHSHTDGNVIGDFKPTCGGGCFQYDSFGSVYVAGDGTRGTNCVAYSDVNCQNKVIESGNIISIGGTTKCLSANGGRFKSLKCYFAC